MDSKEIQKIEEALEIAKLLEEFGAYQEGLNFVIEKTKRIPELFRIVLKPFILELISSEYGESNKSLFILPKHIMIYWDDGIQGGYSGKEAHVGVKIFCAERKTQKGDSTTDLAGEIEEYVKTKLIEVLSDRGISLGENPREEVALIRVEVAEII